MDPGDDMAPLAPLLGEQSVALSRDFRLLQKLRGHRYSVDDMLVAQLACTSARTPPPQVLDLGCGLGSVLLLTAWAFPGAQLVGLEVLEQHLQYARRNVALNRCQERVRVVPGDLRDLPLVASLGRFDLVTGTPPYFARGSGTPCADPARTAAHFELRGGVEDYAAAASQALTADGRFVCCAAADPPGRATRALEQAGLYPSLVRPVIPREGKPPFLLLLVASRQPGPAPDPAPPLVLRDASGRRTEEHRAIRAWTGV